MSETAELLVVGAGAAGCLAAGFAARERLSVLVLERNARPARKILVTGKGRCNVTNDCPPEEFLRHVRGNPRFLYSALHAFPPGRAMAFFEDLGVPLKTERGRRVFPVSERAMDIADALQAWMRHPQISLRQARVKELWLEETPDGKSRVRGVVDERGRRFAARRVLLATGGLSYPATGSTGDGYSLARQAGHTLTPRHASLVRLVCAEDFCGQLEGVSLRNVALSLTEEGKKRPLYREVGEMLFTENGVSGPLVLTASAYMRGDPERCRLTIDLKPGLTPEQLDARLLRDLEEAPNKALGHAWEKLLPRRLLPVAALQAGVALQDKAHTLSRQKRLEFGAALKALELTPVKRGPLEEAVVTAGGVDVREVDPRTMESRLCEGLFFAGEVLDLDAETGGYNLQIAFSTGYLAARGAAAAGEEKR